MKTNWVLLASTLLVLGSNTLAQDAASLAQSKNCMACHSVDNKIVGPSFKQVAQKYAGDAGAADALASTIIKGSSGVWGPIPMPPSPQVSAAEAKTLANWILAQK